MKVKNLIILASMFLWVFLMRWYTLEKLSDKGDYMLLLK